MQLAYGKAYVYVELAAGGSIVPFKNLEEVLKIDPRFVGICAVRDGMLVQMELADLHAWIAEVQLSSSAPVDVKTAFDRARSMVLYAFFDYDLLVPAEIQAFGTLELALKHRLDDLGKPSRGTLRNRVDVARKVGILPPLSSNGHRFSDPIEAMIELRNGLSHGTADVHLPAMAVGVIESCAGVIGTIYPG